MVKEWRNGKYCSHYHTIAQATPSERYIKNPQPPKNALKTVEVVLQFFNHLSNHIGIAFDIALPVSTGAASTLVSS
jgi:hypothetical protein